MLLLLISRTRGYWSGSKARSANPSEPSRANLVGFGHRPVVGAKIFDPVTRLAIVDSGAVLLGSRLCLGGGGKIFALVFWGVPGGSDAVDMA